MQGVKVCWIHLFRCLSRSFQHKNYVWKREFFGWSNEMKYCLLHFDRFQSIKMLINFASLQMCNCHLTHIGTGGAVHGLLYIFYSIRFSSFVHHSALPCCKFVLSTYQTAMTLFYTVSNSFSWHHVCTHSDFRSVNVKCNYVPRLPSKKSRQAFSSLITHDEKTSKLKPQNVSTFFSKFLDIFL